MIRHANTPGHSDNDLSALGIKNIRAFRELPPEIQNVVLNNDEVVDMIPVIDSIIGKHTEAEKEAILINVFACFGKQLMFENPPKIEGNEE